MEYPETPDVFFPAYEKELCLFVQNVMQQIGNVSHDYRHIIRVVSISLEIAKEMGESSNMQNLVRVVALLHDMFDAKLQDGRDNEKNKSHISTLLNLDKDRISSEDVIEVTEKISWSRFRRDGIPVFKGPNQKEMLKSWKIVSMADWMDAGLIVRARDHAIFTAKSKSIGEIKKDVEKHWIEKLSKLSSDAEKLQLCPFPADSFAKMKKLSFEQEKFLELWLKENQVLTNRDLLHADLNLQVLGHNCESLKKRLVVLPFNSSFQPNESVEKVTGDQIPVQESKVHFSKIPSIFFGGTSVTPEQHAIDYEQFLVTHGQLQSYEEAEIKHQGWKPCSYHETES